MLLKDVQWVVISSIFCYIVQIAQHRRLYLAHFDVDGNVDVQTGDNRNGDSRITEGITHMFARILALSRDMCVD